MPTMSLSVQRAVTPVDETVRADAQPYLNTAGASRAACGARRKTRRCIHGGDLAPPRQRAARAAVDGTHRAVGVPQAFLRLSQVLGLAHAARAARCLERSGWGHAR